jgi:hypothetical protein
MSALAQGPEGPAQQRVEVEEMSPHPPDQTYRAICAAMVFVGALFSAVAVIFNQLWGPLRIILISAGVALVILGFLLALGARGIRAASGGDGCEASADMPAGYTKTITVSGSPEE